MSKGTHHINRSCPFLFLPIFLGPLNIKELHEKIAHRYFEAFFPKRDLGGGNFAPDWAFRGGDEGDQKQQQRVIQDDPKYLTAQTRRLHE